MNQSTSDTSALTERYRKAEAEISEYLKSLEA